MSKLKDKLFDLWYDFCDMPLDIKIAIPLTIILICICVYTFIPIHDEATISGYSWAWEVTIEDLRTVEEQGWYPPSDARIKDKEWRHHGSHRVLSGYDDDGNPIYHTVQDYDYYYTYDVDRWFFNRNAISQNNDKTPVEPSYTLSDKERVSKSEITYYIHTDEKVYESDKEDFMNAELGSTVIITRFRFSDKILKMKVV